ncbi:MAG TPA: pitrilysin family protein [Solirubrobacteraceae bacterium]|nr:pitrilysin family protein [Solirubrobacteraceae bacterium]
MSEQRTTALADGVRMTALPDGVRVITERVENVRSVALGFWIGTGSAMESDAQAGMSHLLEHMLFRGTLRYRSQQIDEIFDAMGAEINAGTDRESTSLYTRVLDRHLERAFDVAADMVWRPRFEELDAERQVVLEEIAMYEDDPQDRVFDLLGEAVFGAHPLGRATIGTAEVVGAVTLERLRSFHAERYAPRRIVIAAAGSVDHDALVELARAAGPGRDASAAPDGRVRAGADGAGAENGSSPATSGSSPATSGSSPASPGSSPASPGSSPATPGSSPGAASAPLPDHYAAVPGPQFERRVRFLSKDTEQYHVCLGGRGISRHDERRFALRVLEGVLGSTSSSRLFQEVRERRGLAYSVFSFSSQYAATGEVGLYVGTRPDNLDEALDTIARELERFIEDPASPQELDRSRENLKGRVALSLESTAARMNRLGSALLGDLPILSVDEIVDRIDAVQVADLRELARELFAPETLSAAGIGAEEEIFRRALAPLENVPARARAMIGARR